VGWRDEDEAGQQESNQVKPGVFVKVKTQGSSKGWLASSHSLEMLAPPLPLLRCLLSKSVRARAAPPHVGLDLASRSLHLPRPTPAPPTHLPISNSLSSTTSPLANLFRSAFRTPSSASTPPRRAFSLSALVRGPRPYYGGGGGRNAYGGQGRGGWRQRIDAISQAYVLYSIIGKLPPDSDSD
jgi:hypothetical protein